MQFFKIFVLCNLLTLTSSFTFSQENNKWEKLNSKFKQYELAEIPTEQIYQQLNTQSRNNDVIIPLGNGMKWTMELELNPIFSEKYSLVFGDKTLGNPIKQNRVKPMVGKLKNVPDSEVTLSFNKNFIFGEVRIGLVRYFIEPLSYHVDGESPDKFIYYSIHDIILDNDYKCGYENYKEELEKLKTKDEKIETRRVGECFVVEYALAADWSMVVKLGTAVAVENHITGVINNVQTNWDNEFADEIQFEIVTFWISSCSSCDPWSSSTDPYVVLPSFANWASSGGFNTVHDVASMWSNRVYIDNIVGLAYVNVVCSGLRYNVLRDFTSNPNFLRVMNSHELGHNFNAVSSSPTGHDPSGSNTIMAPSVNSATSWSSESITLINAHIASRTCLGDCPGALPQPEADFTYNIIDDCVVGEVHFFDQSTNATSRLWTFPGGTPSTSTALNPVVMYNNVGTYGATLSVTNSAGTDTKTLNNIIVIDNVPTSGFTYTVNGSQVTFTNTSTNANSYSWDFGDGDLSTENNPVHIYLLDGFYTVVLTAINECGPSEFSVVIEIATPPVADFSAVPTMGCISLGVMFQDNSTPNTIQWNWTFQGGNPATSFSQNPSVIYNAPGLYSVTLTATNPQGSNTIVRQQYINVIGNPTSSFTYVKNGLTATFTNTSSNTNEYLWNFGDGNTSTLQNPVHTYASAGTYTVTLQSINDCNTVSSSQTIQFIFIPIAGFTTSNPSNGCTPYTVNFVNTSQNNPTSLLWTFEGGNPATSADNNPSVSYTATGSYDVTLIATNSAGSDTLTISNYITISTTPTAGFTYQNNGLTYTFTGNFQNQTSVLWNFGDGNTSSELNPVHTYNNQGNYTVVATAINNCGQTSATQQINVVLSPVANFSATPLTGCTDLTVQFNNESSSNTTSWNWSFPGGNPSTSTLTNPVVVYNQQGAYSVTLIAGNSAGQSTITKNNYINPLSSPTTGFTIDVNGPNVIVTNTGSGATSTEWQIQDNGFQSFSGNSISYTFSSNGTFSIRQINTNNCGSNNLEQFVTINAYPIANFIGNASGNCAPLQIAFNNTSLNGTSFQWTFENGNPGQSNEENPTVTFAEAGQFTISLTATNQYGTNTSTQLITISGAPQPEFTFITNSLNVNFANMTISSGNTNYSWNFGDGATSSETNPSHTYSTEGTYEVTLTVTNECGTSTVTQTVVVDNRAPVVSFSSSQQSGCAPFEVQFTDNSTNDPTNWFWEFEGGSPATSTEKNPLIIYENEGIFDVTLTVTNSFGTSTVIFQNYITVYGPPEASFEYTLINGQIITTYNGNNVSSYNWDFGDGTRRTEQSPIYNYTVSGNYTITLIVENPCGSDTINTEVEVIISDTQNPEIGGFIKVAPNPASESFNLIFEKMAGKHFTTEILNVNGITLNKSNHTISSESDIKTFEVISYPPGTYILKIVNKEGISLLKKIVIIK
jgi:PKD repeat protein